MQVNDITFDLTFDSFSNTAMDVIQDITKVTRAITVILLITPAQFLKKKHRRAIIRTVIKYLIKPPLLKNVGMIKAAHITPNKMHLSTKYKNASIISPFVINLL